MPSPWWTSQSTTTTRSIRPFAAQPRGRDRDVVEQAVAAGEVAAGVVGAAAEVHAEAVLQRVPGGGQRPADRAPAALDEHLRPRQPEPALFAHGQLPVTNPTEQVLVVDGGEPLPRHRLGLADGHATLHPLAQQRVLRDRELVPRGQRDSPAVVAPDVHQFSCTGAACIPVTLTSRAWPSTEESTSAGPRSRPRSWTRRTTTRSWVTSATRRR